MSFTEVSSSHLVSITEAPSFLCFGWTVAESFVLNFCKVEQNCRLVWGEEDDFAQLYLGHSTMLPLRFGRPHFLLWSGPGGSRSVLPGGLC